MPVFSPSRHLAASGFHADGGTGPIPTSRGAADAEAVVRRARAGDRAAEETIYRWHVAYVAGMVLRLLANRTEAEDVVQDTFVIAFGQLSTLRDPGAVRPWLAQIAVNEVRHRLRKRRLMQLLGLRPGGDAVDFDSIAAPSVGAETRTELAALGRLLGTLPANQRIAWSLRYVEGATLEEVALTCACSLATAKRRIAAAHRRVRAVLHVGATAVPLRPRAAAIPGEGA
jgi:RNA polymerase sigma-70 factor (ECF subfamily)